MRPQRSAELATALRRLLGCDVTVAHHLRTAWSLTTAGAADGSRAPGLERWAAIVAQSDLDDGPGLALLSHAQTLAPALPAILLLLPETDLDDPLSWPHRPAPAEVFFTQQVPFTTPADTAHALVRAMGQAVEAQEPSGIGPRPGAELEPLVGEPGVGAFTGPTAARVTTLRPRRGPFRWR